MPDELDPEGVKHPHVIEPEPRIARLRRWLKTPAKLRTWAELRDWLTTLALPSTNGGRVAVAVIVVLLLVPLWLWYASGQKDDKGAVTYPHASLINPILGGLGALFLIYAAIRQARTATKQAQIAADRHAAQTNADLQRRTTETFSTAVEQLGSEKMEVRVGGIYTLERLAIEALASPQPADHTADEGRGPDLYWTVMETLTAFVRERARCKEPDTSASETVMRYYEDARPDRTEPATDVAAVLSVIRRRPEAGRARERQRAWWLLDFRATDLRGADLRQAHLERAILTEAHLEGAFFVFAYLEGANLIRAHLEDGRLGSAHCQGANFSDAHLQGAHFARTHLKGAHFGGAHLEGADLSGAHLDGVHSLDEASGDARTRLPTVIARPAHWPPYDPNAPEPKRADRSA
jgi:hypothetical protein